MKVMLDIKGEPKENDILFWNGEQWECIAKGGYLYEINKNISELKESLENLKKENETLKTNINNRLKEYHDILKIIGKGE